MRRSTPNRQDNSTVRRQWANQHHHCFACGIPSARAPWPGAAVHHIVGGSNRSDEPTNLALLCARCHSLYHGDRIRKTNGTYWPRLTLGMVLTLKASLDPQEYDPARLAVLRGQALPEQEGIPEDFLEEFRKWLPNCPIPNPQRSS